MGKYLSKHSPIKGTCSWRDKHFVIWTLKRRAKIFLRTAYWTMKISWKHPTGGWGKIFEKNPYKVKIRWNFFVKRKKFSKKYKISITFTTLLIALSICFFLRLPKRKNTKLHSFFFAVPTILETAMEVLPLLVIYLLNWGRLDLVLNMC